MRTLIISLLATAAFVPLAAHAEAPWCPVPPSDAAAALPAVTHELSPLLDSIPQPPTRVHTEGTLPHKGIRDESIVAERQLPLMRDAAFAWRAGAGDAYLAMATRYLNAWVATYQPDLNPIDETPFDSLIDTFAVIQSKMDPKDREAARAFFAKWARDYIASMDAKQVVSESPQASSWNNNWQSHRVKLVTMIAVALDDEALFNEARRLFRAQVDVNIHADGEVIDFPERDALHYVTYDLEPLSRAVLAARLRGEDWFNYQAPGGGSVAKAFAWLYPYANGDKPHEEFKNSKVIFDAQRAAVGEKGYSGPFDPQTAATVMWTGGQFVPDYLKLAQKLKATPPTFISMCGN